MRHSLYVPRVNEIIVCRRVRIVRSQPFSIFLYGKGGTSYVRILPHFILMRRLFSMLIPHAPAPYSSSYRTR